jgi:hypothetical protein
MNRADAELELFVQALCTGLPQRMRARGWSMHPAIADGAQLTLLHEPGPPKLGDVVMALMGGVLVVHRVVGWRQGAVLLCGDAHRTPDGWVQWGDVLARVTGIA